MEKIMQQCLQLIKEYEVLSPFWNLALPYVYFIIFLLCLIFLGIFVNTALLLFLCRSHIKWRKNDTVGFGGKFWKPQSFQQLSHL